MVLAPPVSPFLSHVPGILCRSTQKEVRGVHACAHVAPVAHCQSRRNLPPKKLPRHPMRALFASFKARGAITIGPDQYGPQPAAAAVLVYPRQKFFSGSKLHLDRPFQETRFFRPDVFHWEQCPCDRQNPST